MKRLLLVLAVFGMCSAALFAQNIKLSAGLGGNFTADFTSFALTKDAKDADLKAKDWNSHLVGGGFYLFFDATYVEANVGLLFGNANSDKTDGMSDDQKKGMDVTAIKLGLFGKYPIDLGSFTLFPMLGIDGQLAVGGKFYGEEPADKEEFNKMFSWFWIKLGVGADIPLAEKFYLRPEFLYGIRLNTEDEKDTIDYYNSGPTKMVDAIVGHGLDVRVAVGYRF
ncbi:MAG: porin family protein [Treponema sp.]|jgi:hypothetical protein|nr:porin family protein [Treponema sp.]